MLTRWVGGNILCVNYQCAGCLNYHCTCVFQVWFYVFQSGTNLVETLSLRMKTGGSYLNTITLRNTKKMERTEQDTNQQRWISTPSLTPNAEETDVDDRNGYQYLTLCSLFYISHQHFFPDISYQVEYDISFEWCQQFNWHCLFTFILYSYK